MKSTLKIGTRASPLALVQSRWVAAEITRRNPGVEVEEVRLQTQGDKILDTPLSRIGGKGLFVKEIEEALLEGRVDLAVHSMKDLPARMTRGLVLGCVPKRADPRDALCAKGRRLADLPPGARVGTTSLRRKCQLARLRPDLAIEDLRGNVDTRLRRLAEGRFDAIVLAAAGMTRLGLLANASQILETEEMLPAVGQGALAIEIREDDRRLQELLAPLRDEQTRIATAAERSFLERLEGGCQVPVAAHAVWRAGHVHLKAFVCDLEGKRVLQKEGDETPDRVEALGRKIADDLLSSGAGEILEEIYRVQGAGAAKKA